MKATQLLLTELPPGPEPELVGSSEPTVDVRTCEPAIDLSKSASDTACAGSCDDVVDLTDDSAEYLSARDRRILALERQWFSNAGSKEAAITRQFEMTPTRYFQVLNGLLDDPRAMREYPQVVARLRRLRTARQRSRRRHRRVLRHRS